tara:strand:- start:1092 stop:3956 length:2865 start_codon:yes stop_codon:yes gene_type:complete
MSSIENVLQKYIKKNDTPVTHTIIPNENNIYFKWGKSFHVPNEDLKVFNNYLYKFLFNKNQRLSLTESFGDICPLMFDLDIKYTSPHKERHYTTNELIQIIKLIWNQIQNSFNLLDDSSDECWITEKVEPYYEEVDSIYNIKDGIHIIFPNIIGHRMVFKEFMKLFTQDSIINELQTIFKVNPSNELSSIFDTNVQRWFVYGDGKCGKEPYLITKYIFCNRGISIDKLIDRSQLQLTDLDIMNKLCLLNDFKTNIEYKNGIDNILKNAPTNNSNNIGILNMNMDDKENEYDPYVDISINERVSSIIKQDKVQSIEDMVLTCYTVERATNYDTWWRVGACLKNVGGDLLFDVFDKFSQKSESYESTEVCRKFWDGFTKDGLNEPTLYYWAMHDNYEQWKELKRKDIDSKIRESIIKSGKTCNNHDDIANVVYHFYKDRFLCIDLKNDWVHFTNHRWEKCTNGYLLQRGLTEDLKEIYYKYHTIYKEEKDALKNKGELDAVETMEKRESAAYNIYDKFKDINFQKHIMEACRIKFYKPNLLELFDTNTKLIGFENCVFDMENNILRYGQADDYITMTTKLFLPIKQSELPMSIDELWTHIQTRSDPINKSEAIKKSASTNKDWRELIELEWDKHKSTRFFNAVFKDINRFFEQIMPDIEIRKYCMEFIANRLCGDVFKQRFSIWTGSGGNGKSMLIDLIESVFGDYCKGVPVSLLTQKRKASNAACPEKAILKGVRFGHLQEPDSNERINVGEMKELTGGDTIQARKLYGDVFEFKPQFELVLMCNEKPTIDDKTNGAWRRVQVYPFISHFTDDKAKHNKEKHIYPLDNKLQLKIREYWPLIFAGILLNKWGDLSKQEYPSKIPQSILLETENYQNDSDLIGRWMKEELIECDNTTDYNELYEDANDWYEEMFGNGRFDKNEIRRKLIDWQKSSKFGYSSGVNGIGAKLKFNLISK